MKKLLFLIFFPTILYSQTLTINKGKILDVNDSIEIKLEVDSLLNYYTFDELKSESITISLDRVEVKRKYTGNDNPNFETFNVTDRLDASAKKIILVQEDTTKLIFRKKINQTFLDYFKIDDNEALVEFKIDIEFPNYRYGDDDKERKFFRKNTGSNLGFDCRGTRECIIYFYDRIDKSVYTNHFSISNIDIKSNLDAILKESTSDINLVVREDCGSPSDNCDRWTANNSVRLETPIVEDFTGDGKKDVLGRVYNVYYGDIDWQLTEDEKNMYFSRWALFEAVDVSGDSLVYKLNKYYDQISEGIKVFSIDYNNDGHLDIYTKPDVYHGFQTNKPSGWTRDGLLYINDGSGNFQLSDDDEAIISQTGIKNSEIFQNLIQVDADNELEIVYSQNKFDARYIVAHPHIKLTLVDKVGDNYQKNEVELITEPETGYKILTRDFLDKAVYDINNDGYKDLLVWYSQNEVKENYIDNSGAYIGPNPLTSTILAQQEKRKIIAFHGSSSGFNLDMNASTTKVLYEYNTIPGMEAYSFEIIEFKEGMNLLMIMDISGGEAFNDYGINYDGPNSKISALKLGVNSVEDVTDQIFLGDDNKDYMGARNELLFSDLNNDGLIDMYNWRDTWSQENITQPSQFFINNGTNFIPYHCATNDFGNGGFDLVDFNSDGYYDMLYNVDGTFTKSTNIDVAYEVDNDGYLVKKDGEGVLEIIQVLYNDKDDDKIADREDNCIDIDNFDQNDKDKDGLGNKCDPDDDGDEVLDVNDNCRLAVNPDQLDTDGDGIGDACDTDDDGDGVKDSKDNCPLTANPDQKDTDGDGIADACDNCPSRSNQDQKDDNSNGVGDVCDSELDTDNDGFPNKSSGNVGDGINNAIDNCVDIYNKKQRDHDSDGIGDVCDEDVIILWFNYDDGIGTSVDLSEYIEFNFSGLKINTGNNSAVFEINDSEIVLKKLLKDQNLEIEGNLGFGAVNFKPYQIDIEFTHINPVIAPIKQYKTLIIYINNVIPEKKTVKAELKDHISTNKHFERYDLWNPNFNYDGNGYDTDMYPEEYHNNHLDTIIGIDHDRWMDVGFEYLTVPIDLNNDNLKDLLIGDEKVAVDGYEIVIHQLRDPVYLKNLGNFEFEIYHNSNNNKLVLETPQMLKLADLNGDGKEELIYFGEHYHSISYHNESNLIVKYLEKNNLKYGRDFNKDEFKKFSYLSVSNNELVDSRSKIDYSNCPDCLFSIYSHTVGDVDNDGDIDVLFGASTHSNETSYGGQRLIIARNHGNGNLKIEVVGNGGFETSESDMILFDINDDNYKDLVFTGNKGLQFMLNDGSGNIIYNYNNIIENSETIEIGSRNFKVLDIENDGTNELIIYFSGGFGNSSGGPPYNKIEVYKTKDNSLERVTDSYFNDNENVMGYYYHGGSFVQFIDLDNDGIIDLVPKYDNDREDGRFFVGDWNNSKGFQYFKYDTVSNKYKVVDLGVIGTGYDARRNKEEENSLYNNFEFIDLDNDGLYEFVHLTKSHFQIYKTKDLDNDGIADIFDLDDDGDGVLDTEDNCPLTANSNQLDTDSDGIGDVCDIDDDNDTILDDQDNCPLVANMDQLDTDSDGIGDVCDTDDDNDTILDDQDNCPLVANTDQLDTDSDGIGDVCDTDDDNDTILDDQDNCPLTVNTDQADWDNDGIGDVCGDPKPLFSENVTFVDNVYPNPTDDKLRVTIKPGVAVKDLYFVDFSGKTIKPKSVSRGGDNLDINVSNLNEGIYVLEIVSDKEVDKVKVVIER